MNSKSPDSSSTDPNTSETSSDNERSFAETALRLSGKTEEESVRTGAVDKADDQVEKLFASQYKTTNSPIHKAIWSKTIPFDLLRIPKINHDSMLTQAMQNCLTVLQKHRQNHTLYDNNRKISEEVLQDLAKDGYWGMLIDKKYGGQGVSTMEFMHFLANVALIDPTTAGLASVHGCIGAVDPIRTFGNEDQKNKYLPKLASGEMLSGFALTEPNAGSDLTALKTTATLDGDNYIVTGEKIFITNAIPGRTVGLVCLVDNKPAVLITELPLAENENFQIVNYDLYALQHTFNNGLKFNNFKVNKANLLTPQIGDGLTIAYHGLNLGRLALCANATAVMKVLLANMLPWANYRRTYGQSIDTRELVKHRIAKTASLIVGSESLYLWGAWLLDQGYRGELECIIAKVFGSEAQKEVAIEYFMKTHGGRSFVKGHLFGDNMGEYLAPSIYEGEGEMLSMAFFKSLAKDHGSKYFEPIAKTLYEHKIKNFNPLNPLHLFLLRANLIPYSLWWLENNIFAAKQNTVYEVNSPLKEHLDFATQRLTELPAILSNNMIKHQLKLADRQCLIAQLSSQVQDTITIIVSILYAHNQGDEGLKLASDFLATCLTYKATGKLPDSAYYKKAKNLAECVLEGKFSNIQNITANGIVFPYAK